MPTFLRLMCALLLAASALPSAPTASADTPPPLHALTFNIRFGTAEDGENHWDKRKDFVADVVAESDPDLVGYQEMMPFQESFLLEEVPGYAMSGSVQGLVGRPQRAESAQIFWKRERFEKLGAGMFYLSRTPDEPGGDDWDSRVMRRVEWVELADREAGGRGLFVFNTHFDHVGKVARLESAKLMRQRMESIAGESPVVVLGDFNNRAPHAEPFLALAAPGGTTPPRLIDTFAAANPDAAWTGTFNGFDGKPQRQARIDWILHTPHFEAESSSINRVARGGRFPSDHYPVEAVLRWRDPR